MTLRLLGGALNYPFVPATVNIGSDLQHRRAFEPAVYPHLHKIPLVTDPFSGKQIGAFAPLRPDLAAIQVTLANSEAVITRRTWSRYGLLNESVTSRKP